MKKILSIFAAIAILSSLTGFTFSAGTMALDSMLTPYADVQDNVHLEAIVELTSRGVVKGYFDGTYRPDKTINRAEFLKILTEAKGDYSPTRDPSSFDIMSPSDLHFDDLSSAQWYIPYIRNAVKNQIISGYPDRTFRPADPINLAEALKMIFVTYKIPTVQFIKAPDHWYDYYTTGLDLDFVNKTHLSASRDIGKSITRGEMASLIVYFEAKAAVIHDVGPHYVDKPLILEKTTTDGSWKLHGYVMFSNGCFKPDVTSDVAAGQPEQVTIKITEIKDELGMCLPSSQEHELTVSFMASADAQIKEVTVDGTTVSAVVHHSAAEKMNALSPLHFKKTVGSNAIAFSGSLTTDDCKTVTFEKTVYDGLSQQVEIDVSITDNLNRRCNLTTVEWPLDFSTPLTGETKSTTVRARTNGQPVQVIVE